MVPGFANNYDGQSPHYEVWYGKVDLAPERAIWFRYTIFDGAVQEASTWAILFDGDDVKGGRSWWELDELARPNALDPPDDREGEERFRGNNQVFRVDGAYLDEANALGSADGISWDLNWEDRERRFHYIPSAVARLPVLKSAYDACFMDLRVSGTVTADGETFQVDGRPGMLGHIHGSKISGNSWAWAHCNSFDERDDAVFEGLSVRLDLMGMETPPVSAFVLHLGDDKWEFRTPLSMVLSESVFERDSWTFEVDAGGARLTGRATAPPPERVALVEYDDTDGSKLWCYNSKLADLELRIQDPVDGIDERLTAEGTSAFEYVTRELPDETPLI
jgi:hypothetical protein